MIILTNNYQDVPRRQRRKPEMDRSGLVMELVFSNQQTFKGLSDFEVCVLQRTSKIIQKNENIMNAILKFRVYNAYDELYFLIVDGCYATHHAYNEVHRKEAHAIFERTHEVRKHIAEKCKSDSAFRDCFSRLVMAEYKENLYDMTYDPSVEHMDRFIYDMSRSYFVRDLALGNPKKYIHDPDHFMCKRYTYKFHDFEKKAGSIIAVKRTYNREIYMDRIRGKRWYDENDEELYYADYVDSDDEYSDNE
jgi:hypothetical protein